jgi:hypothetical protein
MLPRVRAMAEVNGIEIAADRDPRILPQDLQISVFDAFL